MPGEKGLDSDKKVGHSHDALHMELNCHGEHCASKSDKHEGNVDLLGNQAREVDEHSSQNIGTCSNTFETNHVTSSDRCIMKNTVASVTNVPLSVSQSETDFHVCNDLVCAGSNHHVDSCSPHNCTSIEIADAPRYEAVDGLHNIDSPEYDVSSCFPYITTSTMSMCDDELRFHKHDLGGLTSQMNSRCWEYYLQYETDSIVRDYLTNGINHGFAIVDSDIQIDSYRCMNYKSVLSTEAFVYVNDLIFKEISDGKYVRAASEPVCVHALGVVPKSDGTFRPITDCKRPLGYSINNYMDSTFQHFTYCTVDEVASNMSENCFMATVDIASAYRSIPIFPDQRKFQAIAWPIDGELCDLLDTHLSFGLRCAPYIFTKISNFVVSTMDRLGYHYVINYIDDFLVYGDSYEECQEAQTVLIHLLGQLGFYVSWKKCTSPARKIKYLGINFDSILMELSLPDDKLLKLYHEIEFFKNRKRATKRQLQRLCGVLSHCSKVVRGGRTFSRRVIDLLKGLPDGNPRIRLSEEFRQDLDWWCRFAAEFNGKEKIISKSISYSASIQTDSCLKGYGLVIDADWQAGYFNSSVLPEGKDILQDDHGHWENITVPDQTNINFLELVPVHQALIRKVDQWSDSHVIIFSDNTQVVSMINKGISSNDDCMHIIREMFWIAARNNIYLTARHIPGELNILPDLLSRISDSNSLESLNSFDLCCRRVTRD